MKERRSRHSLLRSTAFAFLRSGALLLLVAVVATSWAAWQLFRLVGSGLPDVEAISRYEPAQTTRIFANDGSLIATLFHENRTMVPLKEVSPHVVHALLSIEDSRYFQHDGVDLTGIARAAFANLRGSGIEQGASTLTMQLARALFLSQERSITRKIREALLAQRIESRYTKREILHLYLNQVYYGSGAYGIAAASSTYYGKRPSQLTAAQAAMIVGLLQAPTTLSPHVDQRAALQRQLTVLQRMRELGYLTGREHHTAVREAIRKQIRPRRDQVQAVLKYPYFTSHVIKELSARYPDRLLYRGGLSIYTTLDPVQQKKAEAIVRQRVQAEGGWYNAHQAAAALIENQTGFVRALVGGTGWNPKSQFNRATQAYRQPGSSFKPFVYATALERGMTPETVITDSPVTYGAGRPWQWAPANSDHRFMGAIPMRVALMQSRNVVAVKVLDKIGIRNVLDTARALGLKGRLDPYLSLALGASEATPLEMASAYSVFANGGMRRRPQVIKLVLDPQGRILEDHRRPGLGSRVLTERTATGMVDMLSRAVTGGTGGQAQVPGHRVAGKTGTTESYRDAWFVGFTPQYSLAVWVGNDDFKPMWQAYGGDLPARIWREVMGSALVGKKPRNFAAFAGRAAQTKRLCGLSHLVARPGCPRVYAERFYAGSGPARPCTLHTPRVPTFVTGRSLVADGDGDGVLSNSDLRAEFGAGAAPSTDLAER